MLILNILTLSKNKIISLNYKASSEKIKMFPRKNKYIYNSLDKTVIELIELLNFLSIAYLYIYKYMSLKQKILLYTNYRHQIHKLKLVASLTSNYYIVGDNIYPGALSNWELLKRKLIVYKWLKYFFLTNLIIKKTRKNISYKDYQLYLLYLKLKLKYEGLKDIRLCPFTLIFIISGQNKLLEEASKEKKNIILIGKSGLNSNVLSNAIILNTANKNFSLIYFILEVIGTAIFHGLLI